MNAIFFILAAGFIGFGVAASFVALHHFQNYIEENGEHSSSYFWSGGMLRNYKKAHRIANRVGRKPKFLIWFEGLSVAAIAFMIAAIFSEVIAGPK